MAIEDAPVVMPACYQADFDAATGTCAVPVWIPSPTGFPTLSIEDAQSIGYAIALLWATAFVFRRIRKFIDQV